MQQGNVAKDFTMRLGFLKKRLKLQQVILFDAIIEVEVNKLIEFRIVHLRFSLQSSTLEDAIT